MSSIGPSTRKESAGVWINSCLLLGLLRNPKPRALCFGHCLRRPGVRLPVSSGRTSDRMRLRAGGRQDEARALCSQVGSCRCVRGGLRCSAHVRSSAISPAAECRDLPHQPLWLKWELPDGKSDLSSYPKFQLMQGIYVMHWPLFLHLWYSTLHGYGAGDQGLGTAHNPNTRKAIRYRIDSAT